MGKKGKSGTTAKREVIPVPTSLEDAAVYVRQIGEAQRAVDALEANLTQRVEELRAQAMAEVQKHQDACNLLLEGLFAFAQAHRPRLTDDEKRKTVDVATGKFGWRLTPPAVEVKGVADVIATLERLKLTQFIRVKETKEVDREAILKDPDAVAGIAGVSVTQREEFFVKPEQANAEIAQGVTALRKKTKDVAVAAT